MAAAVASRADAAPDLRSDQQELQKLVLTCNKEGMDHLRKGQHKQAFEQLKYAEAVLGERQGEEPTNLLAVTCNNLGCYYKKVGKLHAALSYLRKSLKIEVNLQTDDVTVAGTHLNICAILSKLDKHDKAAQHATCTLELISNRINSVENASKDDYSVLAIAYHNVAVERDYMQQWDQAAAAYQQGHRWARQYLGDQHPLTLTLAKNCETAQQKSQKLPPSQKAAPPTQPASARQRGSSRPPAEEMGGSQTARGPRTTTARAGQHLQTESSQPVQRPTRLPEIPNAGGPQAVQAGKGLPPIQGAQSLQQAAAAESAEAPMARHASMAQPRQTAYQDPAGGAGEWAQPQPSPQAVPATPRELPPLQTPLQQTPVPQQAHLAQEREQLSPTSPGARNRQPLQPLEQQPNLQSSQSRQSMAYSRQNSHQSSQPPEAIQRSKNPSSLATDKDILMASNVNSTRPGSPPPLVVNGRESRPPRPRATEEAPPMTATDEPPPLMQIGGKRVNRAAQGLAQVSSALTDRASENMKEARRAKLEDGAGSDAESLLLRRTAAVKIQVAWRHHSRAKKAAADIEDRRNKAAIKIQARWRAFIVRHRKRSKAATMIQKWVRGYSIRITDKRRKAATTMQRYALGAITRRRIKKLHLAATSVQTRFRGVKQRVRFQDQKHTKMVALQIIQRFILILRARREVAVLRREKKEERQRQEAAILMQKTMRGKQSRNQTAALRQQRHEREVLVRACLMVQAFVRRKAAQKVTQRMRRNKIREMNDASTRIRAHWLKYIYRKRYNELREEFKTHVPSVVVIQRYVRGYLVRMRMWRDAIRSEEELWAAVEIQRCWRGYCGRLKWEMEYEMVWSREAAVRRLQTYIRGWLARSRVWRLRKRKARADFERARRLFKAAQKIQAFVRGRLDRRRVADIHSRKQQAALNIQRVFRGRRKRIELWHQAVDHQATRIQALSRGFLVRKRRIELISKVIMIQRHWRRFHGLPQEIRDKKRIKVKGARAAQPALALADAEDGGPPLEEPQVQAMAPAEALEAPAAEEPQATPVVQQQEQQQSAEEPLADAPPSQEDVAVTQEPGVA